MTDNITTTIDIMRHGQTTKDDIVRGRIDVPLSEHGYQQMQQRVDSHLLEDTQVIPWHALVTSPLQRCSAFSHDIGSRYSKPVMIDEGFLEMDFGDFDGKTFDEVRQQQPELFENIWQRPDEFNPPNGETFAGFTNRIRNAWDNLIDQHQGKHLLLVCHGGVIRALLSYILQAPTASLNHIEIPYACFSRIKIYHHPGEDHWPQLVFHNP